MKENNGFRDFFDRVKNHETSDDLIACANFIQTISMIVICLKAIIGVSTLAIGIFAYVEECNFYFKDVNVFMIIIVCVIAIILIVLSCLITHYIFLCISTLYCAVADKIEYTYLKTTLIENKNFND